MEKKLQPKLRFKEFSGEWKDIKLDNLMQFKNGINASKEQYGKGKKFINVLDILSDIPITYDSINGSVEVSEDIFDKNTVTYGDIVFQRSSETREEVGTANVYVDKDNTATFGGFVIRGKKIGDYNPIFMNKLLKTPSARNEITSKSGGSTRYNLSQSTLSEVALKFPPLPEQEKIASFLSSVDSKIGKLEKKKELLSQYKKGIIQKIFSQEIRFSPKGTSSLRSGRSENGGEYPQWEEKFVKDIYKITRGSVLAVTEMTQEVTQINRYPVFSSQTKNKGLTGYYKKALYKSSITWTTDGANAGDVKYRDGEFYCTNVCGVLLSENGYANQCMSEMLNRITHKYVSYVGNPKLMNGVMGSIKINVPCLEEQEKIANFLSSIDKKIELVEREVERNKEFKKGLLQQMFV